MYVGNLPTKKFTDEQLVDFFQPFGKVAGEMSLLSRRHGAPPRMLGIRVHKGYLWVQYDRAEDARRLIEEDERSPLTLKGNELGEADRRSREKIQSRQRGLFRCCVSSEGEDAVSCF